MALVRIGANTAEKLIVIALAPDSMPSTYEGHDIISLGTFEHAFAKGETDDVLPGSEGHGFTHTLYHDIMDVMRRREAADVAEAADLTKWWEGVTDVENWQIVYSGVFASSTGYHTGKVNYALSASAQAATGSIVFDEQPAVGSTITINGTVFTAVASGATGNQFNIGANLGATLANIVTVLNASAVSGVAAATYSTTGGDTLVITHDTAGIAGNEFTLAASANSNGTPSYGELTGGTATTATLVTKHVPSGTTIAVGQLDFTTSDAAVATVNSSGVVSRVGAGKCKIRARRKDRFLDNTVNEVTITCL
jgi:hypothetical protein